MAKTHRDKLNRSDPTRNGERAHVTTRTQTDAMENEGQGQPQARSEIYRPPRAGKNPKGHIPRHRGSRPSLTSQNPTSSRPPEATPIRAERRSVATLERRRTPVPKHGNPTDDHDADRRGEHHYPGDEHGPDGARRGTRDALKERIRTARATFRP